MLESYNNQQLIVRDYTDNFSVKNYIVDEMIPKAFPGIPMNKLNLGFVGVVSEYIAMAVEDSYYTSSLMLNENFITRAILPDSIYSEAALFDLGYNFATCSKCDFLLELWKDDVVAKATRRVGTSIWDYKLDKDTKIILGDNIYRLDYDVLISFQYMNGQPVFEAQYLNDWVNSIAVTNNRFIKNILYNNGWLVLFVTLQEVERIVLEETVSDNTVTSASDIEINWDNHLAGIDVTYISPTGERLPMKKKIVYSDPEVTPYIYYKFSDDNQIKCTFTETPNYFRPAFNSKIEFTLYICHGASANFDLFDGQTQVIVEKTGDKYEYNVETNIVAYCCSGSALGTDRKDLEMLRDDVKVAYNTANVISTDHDLDEWFNNFAMRYNTKAYFFKRRDDPSGRLFSQFMAITNNSYIYPTNTLNIEVSENQFDFVDISSNEFILKPGHLWKYKPRDVCACPKENRNTLVLVGRDISKHAVNSDGTLNNLLKSDGKAMITDDDIPLIDDNDPDLDNRFMFVNPFYIKITRKPGISACYNYLIHSHTAPVETFHNDRQFLHFQILSVTIDRALSKSYPNQYNVKIAVGPVIQEDMIGPGYKYVQDYDPSLTPEERKAALINNNLRILMVFKTTILGETGYCEMVPTGKDPSGFITFESRIRVNDILRPDSTIEIVDSEVISLVKKGITAGLKFIDSANSMIDFVTLLRSSEAPKSPIYGDPNFCDPEDMTTNLWEVTNRFSNDYRELQLYKPMSMMRSIVSFQEAKMDLTPDPAMPELPINGYGYVVTAKLMPFLKYNIPLDDAKMTYFIKAFNEQYSIVEPVLFERLDNNCHLDLKLFNTYGKSINYYLGDTEELLESVRVRVSFRIAVNDRSSFTTTANSIKNQIQEFFTSLNNNKVHNIYISNLIKILETENPNLNHLKFLAINDSDPHNQYIRARFKDISDLDENDMSIFVPEMIIVEAPDITLTEEKEL
jgi:hypothetical protein